MCTKALGSCNDDKTLRLTMTRFWAPADTIQLAAFIFLLACVNIGHGMMSCLNYFLHSKIKSFLSFKFTFHSFVCIHFYRSIYMADGMSMDKMERGIPGL